MRMMTCNYSKRGITYVTVILLLLLAAMIYGVYVFAPIYMADFDWQREVDGQMIKASEMTDSEMRENLVKEAELLKVPIEEQGSILEISRNAGVITITYRYDKPTPIPGLETIHFEKTLTRNIQKVEHLFNKNK